MLTRAAEPVTPPRRRRVPQTPQPVARARRAPAPSRCCRSNSLPMLVQRELERMILAGELPPARKLNEAAVAERARRLARPGARGLPHARGVRPRPHSRRTAASSCARSRSTKPTRSTTCAPCSTSSSAAALAQSAITPSSCASCAALVERDGEGGARAATPTRYHLLNLAVPRPPGRARRQPQAARDLPPAGQRAAPVSAAPTLAAGRHAAGLGRASTATSSSAIAAGDAAAAGRALHDHVMASRERMRRDGRAVAAAVADAPIVPRRKPAERPIRRSTVNGRRYRWPARAARRRLRRRLRARLHQPGDRRRPRAVPRRRCASAAPA